MAEERNRRIKEETGYTVRYGYDANAALQPQYIPYPEQEPAVRPQPKPQPQQRPRVLPPAAPQKQPETGKKTSRAVLMLGVVLTAVMAFAVVMRNSEIYQNNRSIQEMGQSIILATDELNTAKQQLSAMEDIGAYMQYAGQELDMTFPQEGQYIVITPEAGFAAADLTDETKNDNIVDRFLDWLNSLERRA